MPASLLISGVVFFVAVLGHSIAGRLGMIQNSVARFLVVGSVAGLTLLVVLCRHAVSALDVMAGLTFYAFLCELYIFLFTMVSSSISAKTLRLLWQGPMSAEQLEAVYEGAGMVQRRLERLQATHLIRTEGKHRTLTAKGERLVRWLRFFRDFFHRLPTSNCPI
ncbi:MAG: hypothetical protein KatS3mg105_4155 [Gemmatales bacterium]|nr:MAG: hypothetical protein KatS3mg105_4155 [Gemmatales bacterium]